MSPQLFFSQIVDNIYINKLNYYPSRIMFYKRGIHIKTLIFQDVKEVDGFSTAMLLTMQNHLQGSKTHLEIIEIKYNMDYKYNFFEIENLRPKLN